MRSYEQRTENITQKARKIARRKAWTAVSCVCCLVLVLGVVFSLPIIRDNPPNINVYRQSDYFPLIEKISDYNKPYYAGDSSIWEEIGTNIPSFGAPDAAAPTTPGESEPDKFQETTLNQVAGVSEGDLLKRSANYAFYLKSEMNSVGGGHSVWVHKISAYSVKGGESAFVGEYAVEAEKGTYFCLVGSAETQRVSAEMYLSEDAKTLTLLANCYNEENINYTCVVSLDVSNPAAIAEKTRTYVTGEYLSSRKVNGEFLIVTNFYVPRKPNYDVPETFIPSCGELTDREYLNMGEIYCPDYLSNCAYTVVVKMRERGLDVTSKYAALSYTNDVAVSAEHVFTIRNRHIYEKNGESFDNYTDFREHYGDAPYQFRRISEIVCLEYSAELKNVGNITLDGQINSRYWVDEKDGILRAVTQTYRLISDGFEAARNASLYCVDLSDMKTVASVADFAPNGETVQAVRFDGDKAYVCTAVRNTDPVFAFDLSDIGNITCKDTGTIPGFSINLLKFGDHLLGIGYGETNSILKIELYDEQGSDVKSVASYEYQMCSFSQNYKAHFIDVERQLVGLQIYDYDSPTNNRFYLLLHFDGEQFNVLLKKQVAGDAESARAFYDDGLYLFNNGYQGAFFIESEELFSDATH